jgi:hypothetical protein
MKRLILFFLLFTLYASSAWATRVVDEKFEGAGYEESWTETVGASNTVDEDYATSSIGSPATWDSQCLEVIVGNTNTTQSLHANLASSYAISYSRIEFMFTSEGIGNGGVVVFCDVGSSNMAASSYNIRFYQAAGVYSIYLNAKYDGSNHAYYSLTNILLNTKYIVEVKWDTTNHVWAWRLDGVDQPNNVDATDPITSEGTTSGSPVVFQSLRVGPTNTVGTYCVDNIAIDDTTWVGAEATPSTTNSQIIQVN